MHRLWSHTYLGLHFASASYYLPNLCTYFEALSLSGGKNTHLRGYWKLTKIMQVKYLPHGCAIIQPLPHLMIVDISRSGALSPTHLSVGPPQD